MRRPDVLDDGHNPVDMIRHDHEFIQINMGTMTCNVRPTLFHHASRGVQPHFPVHHVAEQTGPALGANRYKIGTGLRIIVPFQADGPATVAVLIVFHGPWYPL